MPAARGCLGDEWFAVRHTDAARDDLFRLFDFVFDRANTIEEFEAA
jgi:hypothetical protein